MSKKVGPEGQWEKGTLKPGLPNHTKAFQVCPPTLVHGYQDGTPRRRPTGGTSTIATTQHISMQETGSPCENGAALY